MAQPAAGSRCDRHWLLLATGTLVFIQLSCVIEEYIFKQLPRFNFFWFVALFELLIFTLCSHIGRAMAAGGWSTRSFARHLLTPPPRKGPLPLYLSVGVSLAAGTGLGKVVRLRLSMFPCLCPIYPSRMGTYPTL